MTMFCVIATFQKEPCKRFLNSSICYNAGMSYSENLNKFAEIGNFHVVEIFFDHENDAMSYVRRINNGIIKFDIENKCLVEFIR